jgi:biotin transport system substrate-specific component
MKIRVMAQCGLFTALMCICAWISIPFGDTVFTLQTLCLFLSLELLGGKHGSLVCQLYLLLGAAGLPVFSGFRGGLGVLLGMTGGYISGFLAASVVYWAVTALGGKTFSLRLVALILGLLACYALGTTWYAAIYAGSGAGAGIGFILTKCVFPYLLPDGIKLAAALLLAPKLKRHLV